MNLTAIIIQKVRRLNPTFDKYYWGVFKLVKYEELIWEHQGLVFETNGSLKDAQRIIKERYPNYPCLVSEGVRFARPNSNLKFEEIELEESLEKLIEISGGGGESVSGNNGPTGAIDWYVDKNASGIFNGIP